MATATMATAAGAAALLYYTLNRRLQTERLNEEGEGGSGSDAASRGVPGSPSRSRVSRRDVRAPATWLETISTLSETLRFTYSETLGKWPIGDLAFGISFLLKRQGNLSVASIYAGDESVELKGSEVIADLKYLLNLLTLCWHFSKKPFPLFLEETGYSAEDVLMQEPKAGILKPAFTILIDREGQCILLLIRGTHSIRDTLTACYGCCSSIPPYNCTGRLLDIPWGWYGCSIDIHPEGAAGVCLYYLCGVCSSCLYDLGAGRVRSAFITTVINGADLVPTFSAASVDDLRSENPKHFLSIGVCLGSRLPSIANAKARVAGAGAILRPVSTGTQVVMRRARSVAQAAWTRPALQLSSWTCIGPRRRNNASSTSTITSEELRTSTGGGSESTSLLDETTVETTEIVASETIQYPSEEVQSSVAVAADAVGMLDDKVDSDEDMTDHVDEDRMTDVELWQQLESELYRKREGEDDDIVEEMTESTIAEVGGESEDVLSETKEVHRFYPPGKIMHILTSSREEMVNEEESEVQEHGTIGESDSMGIFLTPRSLYGKLRLSKMMINDHYMPIYRRNIEQLIAELEKDSSAPMDDSVNNTS
ncbi:hypothetical protein EJB05_50739 [Eragrostis curvula]|uniref:Mono-/di-acylglycerol lipase N-terminal domain-containing protein n=1 Tax=Eragrostis curvula TaxID=38414 RepID=A0A5J9SXG4_9POAL|nr:hypothetical protein EJB05_50739 [Eragrostis curvula]